jgi:cytochrome c oxidase cbb3-type subunit 3
VLLFCSAFGCLLAQEAPRRTQKPGPSNGKASQIGRQTFESTCASCHGLDGKGGERGPDIATRPDVVRLSDQQILRILRTGIPQAGMPAFAALGSATLSATMNHLRLLQGKGKSAAPSLPGSPDEGKQLFAGKAGCSACHAVQGVGGFLGPDLTTYGAGRSVDEIRGAILSPEKRRGTRKEMATATTEEGQTISGVVRNEDNFSVQLQSQDGTFHFLTRSELAGLTFAPKPLMPEDYDGKLSTTEMNDLVSYLLNVAHLQDQRAVASTKKRAMEEE